jgi:hypothetical protein
MLMSLLLLLLLIIVQRRATWTILKAPAAMAWPPVQLLLCLLL